MEEVGNQESLWGAISKHWGKLKEIWTSELYVRSLETKKERLEKPFKKAKKKNETSWPYTCHNLIKTVFSPNFVFFE